MEREPVDADNVARADEDDEQPFDVSYLTLPTPPLRKRNNRLIWMTEHDIDVCEFILRLVVENCVL